jgi:hypothetical protein
MLAIPGYSVAPTHPTSLFVRHRIGALVKDYPVHIKPSYRERVHFGIGVALQPFQLDKSGVFIGTHLTDPLLCLLASPNQYGIVYWNR